MRGRKLERQRERERLRNKKISRLRESSKDAEREGFDWISQSFQPLDTNTA